MKKIKPFEGLNKLVLIGTPGRIRTCDLQLRRLTPYPLGYGRKSIYESVWEWLFSAISVPVCACPCLRRNRDRQAHTDRSGEDFNPQNTWVYSCG